MTLNSTPGSAGVDWQVAEDAIFSWFANATGVDVIWADQDIPQPPWPFGTLNIINGPDRIGGEDNVRRTTDLTQVGEEVQLEHNGPRHFTVSCQVIQGPPNTHNPNCHARRLATAAQAALSLEAVSQAFIAAGLAVVSFEPITNADIEVGGEWTTRSVFDVLFAYTSSITERVGFIENADIKGTLEGSGTPIVEDFSTSN